MSGRALTRIAAIAGRTTNGSRTVRIDVCGETFNVTPCCDELFDVLSTVKLEIVPDEEHGFQLTKVRKRLFTSDGKCSRFRIGLLPAVGLVLETAGYQVVLTHFHAPIAPLDPPDGDAFGLPQGPIGPLLDFVYQHGRGLISYNKSAVDVTQLLSDLAYAFPTATIAIVNDQLEQNLRLARRLREIGHRVGLHGGRPDVAVPTRRIVVSTPIGLADGVVEFAKRDLIFFPDAVQALSQRSQHPLTAPDNRLRVFGFLGLHQSVSDSEQDRLVEPFGFARLHIPAYGKFERPVAAAFVPIYGEMRAPPQSSGTRSGACELRNCQDLQLKRARFWTNPIRNRQVAKIAKGLVEQGAAYLLQHPQLKCLADHSFDGEVIVLVEGEEHARQLSKHLASWPIYFGRPTDIVTAQLFGATVSRSVRVGMIVTFDGLRRFDLSGATAIIRADGGVGIPAVLGRKLVARVDGLRPMAIIDFDDTQHTWMRRRSRIRIHSYRERGWRIDGVEPVIARVAMFIADREVNAP